MPAPELHVIISAKITLADLSDSSTRNIYLTSRPVSTPDHFPVLEATRDLTLRMGNYIPQDFRASLSIDNRPGSFGHERRLADLFERETPIEQAVVIKVITTSDPSTVDLDSDGDTQLTTKCSSWAISNNGDSLTLELSSRALPNRYMQRVLRESSFDATFPERSKGKTLPICFGDESAGYPAQCKAYKVFNDSTPTYCYATSLANEHDLGGVKQYYAKNRSGEYVAVQSAAGTTTECLEIEAPSPTGTSNAVLLDETWYGFAIDYDATANNMILVEGRLRGQGNTNGSTVTDGYIDFKLVTARPSGEPDDDNVLGTARIEKVEYDGVMNGADTLKFWYNFSFDAPVILPDTSQTLFLMVRSQSDSYPAPEYVDIVTETSATDHTRYIGFTSGYWTDSGSSTPWPIVDFFGVVMTDTPATSGGAEGLGGARFELTQKSADTANGQTAPSLLDLEFFVDIDGLEDDPSGTITGSAGSVITRPDHALKLLSQSWNGSNWTTPLIGTSTFSTELTNLYGSGDVKIAGQSRGNVDLLRLVEDICRSCGARLFVRSGGLQLYAEGTEQTVKAEITDEHANVIGLINRGAGSFLFNRGEAFCQRRLINLDVETGSAEGQFRDYYTTVKIDDTSGEPFDTVRGNSEDIYGVRYLANQSFDWTADESSLEKVLELMLRKWAFPNWFVTLEIPLATKGAFVTNASALQLGDVVAITHPDIPAYFGTSSSAAPPTYNGAEVQQGGKHEKRARRVRAMIEGRTVSWAFDTPAILRLECRIIGDKELT